VLERPQSDVSPSSQPAVLATGESGKAQKEVEKPATSLPSTLPATELKKLDREALSAVSTLKPLSTLVGATTEGVIGPGNMADAIYNTANSGTVTISFFNGKEFTLQTDAPGKDIVTAQCDGKGAKVLPIQTDSLISAFAAQTALADEPAS
jgi:hypothetical protein